MSRYELRRRKLGPLDTLDLTVSEDAPTVVLFHGYGADAADLASLAQVVQLGRPVNWLFPNGHLEIDIGGGFMGRAWFPLRLAELEAQIAAGTGLDLSEVAPPGMKRAREGALEMLKALKRPLDRMVLGGFSQGAMLAIETTMRLEQSPAGVAILSGALIDANSWRERAPAKKGLKFFQSHGLMDQILNIHGAQTLEKFLLEAGWQGKLMQFHGQHEIPPDVLIQLTQFLRQVLPK